MPIRDSQYTDPDALRLLYLNPRNPLRETSDLNSSPTIQPTVPTVPNPFPGGTDTGDGGPQPSRCPALTEYVLSCVGILRPLPQPIPVSVVRKGMRLWNPISQKFSPIAHCEVVPAVNCVQVRTFSGIQAITSESSLGIVDLSDTEGRRIFDLLIGVKGAPSGAVSWIMGQPKALPGAIEKIYTAGKRDVMHITLEPSDENPPIYATGTKPTKLICWHNKAKQELE